MKVTRLKVLDRGLRNRCPNCGGATLFQAGSWFEVNKSCGQCGLVFERDEGFFIGSMSINYGVTLVLFLGPIIYLTYQGYIGTTLAVVLSGIGALGFPVIFYRSSRSWWLMQYYLLFPRHLPANDGRGHGADDHNT